MDRSPSFPLGDIVHARIHVTLIPRKGWNVLLQVDVELAGEVSRHTDRYSELSRGELITVVDAIRDQLDLPLSEYSS